MNKRNYNAEMERILINTEGKKLLLHSCCAPCSSHCLSVLYGKIRTTVFYFNPNIEEEEYLVRKAEQIRLLKETGWADFLDCDHDQDLFYQTVKGFESFPEGGARCYKCFELRLEETAKKAKELGYDYFTTTLTVSPLKNAEWLNQIGEKFARIYGVSWLPTDFKKKGGYLDSIEKSKQYNLYRQNYCGCKFSRMERERDES